MERESRIDVLQGWRVPLCCCATCVSSNSSTLKLRPLKIIGTTKCVNLEPAVPFAPAVPAGSAIPEFDTPAVPSLRDCARFCALLPG